MGLIIGIDGGGTKSTALVYSRAKNEFKSFTGNSINYHSIGNALAIDAFNNIINQATHYFNEGVDSIVIGSAALSVKEEIQAEHPFFLAVNKICNNNIIVSDLYIGLKGVDSKPSIFLISGTGSMIVSEASNEQISSIGGWGYLLGDQGSGYWIGLEGIKKAITGFEGLTEETLLTEYLLNHFNLNNLGEIIDLVYSKKISNKEIANFAVSVHRASDNGDEVANSIIKHGVNYLVDATVHLLKKLNTGSSVSIGVFGGNFEKSKSFKKLFTDSIEKTDFNISVDYPKFLPVESAIILAAEKVGLNLKTTLLNRK